MFHCEEGKQAWIAQGGTSAIIGGAPVLYNPSTEGFYQTFNEFIDFNILPYKNTIMYF